MTQTNCPNCDSTRLQHQEIYGYWECDDCGHAWALDVEDPDYDEIELCSICHGKKAVAFADEILPCTLCNGRGTA